MLHCDPPVGETMKPGTVEIDLFMLEGLSSNATVIGDVEEIAAPSSARKDVSMAR